MLLVTFKFLSAILADLTHPVIFFLLLGCGEETEVKTGKKYCRAGSTPVPGAYLEDSFWSTN